MKKILFLLLIFISSFTFAQGSITTPYDTLGWDAPIDYTTYYNLPVYRLLSNPGGWININQRMIDGLLNDLIVYTDTTQMIITNDTLRLAPSLSGHNSFVTTAQVDTVLVTGLDSLDVIVVTPREATPTSNDVLGVIASNGKFIVTRPASGTSGLKYNWIWIRKYQ